MIVYFVFKKFLWYHQSLGKLNTIYRKVFLTCFAKKVLILDLQTFFRILVTVASLSLHFQTYTL